MWTSGKNYRRQLSIQSSFVSDVPISPPSSHQLAHHFSPPHLPTKDDSAHSIIVHSTPSIKQYVPSMIEEESSIEVDRGGGQDEISDPQYMRYLFLPMYCCDAVSNVFLKLIPFSLIVQLVL